MTSVSVKEQRLLDQSGRELSGGLEVPPLKSEGHKMALDEVWGVFFRPCKCCKDVVDFGLPERPVIFFVLPCSMALYIFCDVCTVFPGYSYANRRQVCSGR